MHKCAKKAFMLQLCLETFQEIKLIFSRKAFILFFYITDESLIPDTQCSLSLSNHSAVFKGLPLR